MNSRVLVQKKLILEIIPHSHTTITKINIFLIFKFSVLNNSLMTAL